MIDDLIVKGAEEPCMFLQADSTFVRVLMRMTLLAQIECSRRGPSIG